MLHVVADENMPMLVPLLGSTVRVTTCNGRSLRREQLLGADVLFVRSVTRVDEHLLDGTPVRFVGTATSGTEHVDTAWLQARGIGFSRAPGSNANSVAEYVLSVLAVEEDWLDRVMAGATVGIVGYGPVGQAVSARLQALGARCRVSDPWLNSSAVPGVSSPDEVLECELICLHPALTPLQPWPSHHLLGEKELARLGAHQMLVNASRGAVVDNSALLRRLATDDAPCVVLDVWEGEPELNRELLAGVRLGTAHIAGYSLDGKILATRMLCEALETALATSAGAPAGMHATIAQKPPVLSLEGGQSGAGLVRELILKRYDVRDDDSRLRNACIGAEAVGPAFDALRKHYPERRELAGSDVSAPGAGEDELALIRALGCTPL